MNIFRKLERFILELQGSRRCPTPELLVAYMREKQGGRCEAYEALHWWVECRMWYTRDSGKGWKQNWTPLREVLARDVPGKAVESDCEERGIVKKHVVNALGWGHAENLVVWADNNKMAGGKTWCHAACLVWDSKGVLLMDYAMHRRATPLEAVLAMGQAHRVTPTRYCYCNDQGVKVSEVFYIK